MAKLVQVEHYTPDGSMRSYRTRMRDWKKFCDETDELEVGEFYVVWHDLQRRWDGAKRMRLHGFLVRCGYKVSMDYTASEPCPVVYPDDE